MSGLVTPTRTKGSFSPGWCHQPGQKGHPLVLVGVTNQDKRVGPFIPDGATNRDKRGSFCPRWCLQLGQKTSVSPVGPASRWTRDKRWLLFRVQRLVGPAEGQRFFVPVGGTNRDKRTPSVPVGGSIRDKRPNPFVPVGGTNPD